MIITGEMLYNAIYPDFPWCDAVPQLSRDFYDAAAQRLNAMLSKHQTQPLVDEPALTLQEAAAIRAVEDDEHA